MINNRQELITLLQELESLLELSQLVLDDNPYNQVLKSIKDSVEARLADLRFYLATHN